MAFTVQSTSGVADFVSKLNTFLSGQGWTTHHVPASGEFAAFKNPSGSVWITLASQWDTATPSSLGIYQWHGAAYSGASSPWNQTNDSGSGAASTNNTTLSGQRNVNLTLGGTIDKFWCFEDDNYFHVVVRTGAQDRYQSFGAGYLTKYNDWTGGEYCFATAVDTAISSLTPTTPASSYLLDGISANNSPGFTNMDVRCATMHIEGMHNQGGTSKWAVCMGNQLSTALGLDRAGVARIHVNGGFRSGLFAHQWGNFVGTFGRGLVPMYPILPVYWNRVTNNVEGPLGYMPDVRGINISQFLAEDEITVGSDTWVVFPIHRRQDSGGTAGFTGVSGMAFKQVA